MKSTSFCHCLAILIVALPNSHVHSYKISPSSARYTGPKEQNKITNSSLPSKISSSNLQPSDRRPYDRQELASTEKQNTKRSSIELSTTKYQNSQRSNANVPTKKVISPEHDTSTRLGNQVFGAASDTQTSMNLTRSKPVATNVSSLTVGRTHNQAVSSLPTGSRPESTTILDTEKSTSAPFSASTSSKFNSRFGTKATTTGGLTTSSTGRSSSTTAGLRSSSTTESSATRASKTKNGDGVVFPASTTARATSKTSTTQRPTSTEHENAIPSSVSTILPPRINGTSSKGNNTDVIDTKVIIDVPEFGCKEGEKKDQDNVCRKVL